MPTEFVLGPSLDSVTEPEPTPAVKPGRRGVEFQSPPNSVGGIVNLKVLPGLSATDAKPLNVYAFFVSPPSKVPPPATRTTDWYFKESGGFSASTDLATEAADEFIIKVPGVLPGVYHLGTVLEYTV